MRADLAPRPSGGLPILRATIRVLVLGAAACSSAWGAADPGRQIVPLVPLGALEARTVALLLSDQQGGELPGAATWTVEEMVDAGARVRVVVELDGDRLVDDPDGGRLSLGLYGYAVSRDGAVVAHLAKGLVMEDPDLLVAVRDGGLRLSTALQLPAGDHTVRVLVREHQRDLILLRSLPVKIPSGEPGRRIVLPPLIPPTGEGWVLCLDEDPARPAAFPPGLDMAALPVLAPTEATRIAIVVAGALGDGDGPRARVLDLQGRLVGEPLVTVDDAGWSVVGEGVWMRRGSLAPLQLPAGPYRLALTLDGTEPADAETVAELPVVLASVPEATPWVALSAEDLRSGPSRETAGTVPTTALTGPAEDSWEGLYLAAARSLAAQEGGAGLSLLVDLERAVLAAGSYRQLERLGDVERRVASRLAEREAGALAGLAVAHLEVSRRYAAQREDLLGRHARDMVRWLLEELVGRRGDETTRGLARTLLLQMASDAVRASSLPSATSMLEQALRYKEEDPTVLLALGAAHERAGEPRRAVGFLRRLVDLQPQHGEGRLRLALCLARVGDADEAARHLRSLCTGGDGWERIIAWQELGRLLMDAGRLEEASEHLAKGAEVRPDDPTLHVQLALVLDELGRPGDAARVLADLPRGRSTSGPTARLRYAGWPDLHLDDLWMGSEPGIREAYHALGEAVVELDREVAV